MNKFFTTTTEGFLRCIKCLLLFGGFSIAIACTSGEKLDSLPLTETESPPEVTVEKTDTVPDYGWKSYPDVKYVNDMAFDEGGNLWAATAMGVFMLDPIQNTHTKYTREDGLPTNDILEVAITSDGSRWFGTRRGGVSKFDSETWTTYTEDDGLVGNLVRSMALAPNSVLWFGTYEGDGGVSRFDGETWTTYTEEDGLISNRVWSLVIGPDGAIWFGTGGGISRYLPDDYPETTNINPTSK
jgi:ligand-binding sensor domain-containing protein